MCNINRHRNTYKANVLLLLPCNSKTICNIASIDITTEKTFRYMKLADAKSGFLKMHHYVRFLQIGSQILAVF